MPVHVGSNPSRPGPFSIGPEALARSLYPGENGETMEFELENWTYNPSYSGTKGSYTVATIYTNLCELLHVITMVILSPSMTFDLRSNVAPS